MCGTCSANANLAVPEGQKPRRSDLWDGRAMDERPAYKQPDWFTQHVFKPIVAGLTRVGVSLLGSRVLRIRGRTSGEWRETPVNLLSFGDHQYLVAARGETQWVRNLRVSGGGELRVGRRTQVFTAKEIGDDEKTAVLRAYLKRWKWEIGAFFEGVGPDSSEEEIGAEAKHHPVFRLD
jgi:deazaflavin-dependent oxidoreductase (nitroreductase family)